MKNEKNIPMIIGLLIPVLMIVFVAGSIYLPRLLVKARPQYNFLYSTGGSWGTTCFSVIEGKIQKNVLEPKSLAQDSNEYNRVKLYLHDVTKNESKEISLQEGGGFQLRAGTQSPDGFEIIHGTRGHDFFPLFGFSSTDYSTVYLKGHGLSQKLNTYKENQYFHNFNCIGWIER